MIEILYKKDCCGCYGCQNVCPKECISMEIDNEGFWYPKVNKDICIECGLCEKVCPVISKLNDNDNFKHIAYACKNKDIDIRLKSSSGGVFSNLCEYTINNNGIVFGAAFNKDFEVIHMEASTLDECSKFRGSKYVQSKIGSTYKDAKKYLDSGRLVLFSGTQCQIKGLNLYLRKKYNNLITVDVICHGVPSPLVFDIYKKSLEQDYKSNIKDISFRDKTDSWKQYSYKIIFNNNTYDKRLFINNTYSKGFLKDLYLRPSCYSCKSKNYESKSDILLGDYWGIENIHPKFDDDKGTSLVIINSIKGKEVFDNISDNVEILETDLEYATSRNSCIVKSVDYNKNRDKFFNELKDDNLNYLVNKYIKEKNISLLLLRLKKIVKKNISFLLKNSK